MAAEMGGRSRAGLDKPAFKGIWEVGAAAVAAGDEGEGEGGGGRVTRRRNFPGRMPPNSP